MKANAEETMNLESSPSYIKASFKEDGTLRYLVLNEPGEYSKVAKLTFDLPIITEAHAAPTPKP
ncbi:MAG: hypothetical protein K8R23_10560 [Chthoniobacter sp.]|nr:hypothetical protein [Chthoniobacter sp.]